MNFIKRNFKYLFQKFKFSRYVKFYYSSVISRCSSFEGANLVQRNAHFHGEMGYGSYIAEHSLINGRIGRFSSVGPYVRCNSGVHPYSYPYVATSPWFYSDNPLKLPNGPSFVKETIFQEYSFVDDSKGYTIEIGSDCWIGEGVFIVGGVKINDGAMVMAHAVVTKDVPPFAIVGGVPAKIIGYRFADSDIDFLMKTKWWEKDIKWIRNHVSELADISKLKNLFAEA